MKHTLISLNLVCACVTSFSLVLYGQGSGRFTPEAQKWARDLLASNQAKYLSATGRNALQVIAGELSPATSPDIRGFSSDINLFLPTPPAALGEVMVNNPEQDVGAASDI